MGKLLIIILLALGVTGCVNDSDSHGQLAPGGALDNRAVAGKLTELDEMTTWQNVAFILSESRSSRNKNQLNELVKVLDAHLVVLCNDGCIIRKGVGK